MATLIRMPEVLAGAAEGAIQSWLVQVGQPVVVGEPLAEVETEKATVEYAAEIGGTLLKVLVNEGTSVNVGDPIAVVGEPGESADGVTPDVPAASGGDAPDAAPASGGTAPDAAAALNETAPDAAAAAATAAEPSSPAPEPETAAESTSSPVADAPTTLPSGSEGGEGGESGERGEGGGGVGGRLFVSPLVRRLAKERGVDLATLRGTGPGGRIVRADLERGPVAGAAQPAAPATAGSADAATTASAPAASTAPAAPAEAAPASATAPAAAKPAAAPAGAGAGFTEVPHTGMRRAIARRLTESKSTVPHFYLVADCRVDELLALRKSVNEASPVKISVNDFVLKAAAAAFVEVPEANATWTDTAVRRYDSVDMSVAVAIDGGLVTPVLRGVEKSSLSEIARTVGDLASRARSGGLRQHELEGGSFAVSNLGMYGVTEFSAIINPPQSAILAVGAARQQPVVVDGELAVGTVMTVTLSADHRVLDGALAAQWLAAFVKKIESPFSILV
ncbi:dihydrolipoamide acetyltransferase family protein [Herbiconiux sp. KACC 21604]|uniref:dihydrolipoamide acetyltransferase family protein n=1 Tax=unclassified Herbiconiux TaxID=2618217 RepID=UPI001492D68C|nr:dihydrolipoamide acetyltransferase family protein [Herbiconiux sp. SALV-R1]QJU54114.1 2-oxo acid dehydrogenase subunit E2 [Herbiconiux sp. SALV-R1]WPO85165.1 dihydrolipoamide acetyltransferase family protein [Herbiconiux sp. KACC 21604]